MCYSVVYGGARVPMDRQPQRTGSVRVAYPTISRGSIRHLFQETLRAPRLLN